MGCANNKHGFNKVGYHVYAAKTQKGMMMALFNPFPNKPWFLRVCSSSLLKTLWEKEKLLVTRKFSFSCSVFYPFRELPAIFIKLKILSVGKSLKFVVWERVKLLITLTTKESRCIPTAINNASSKVHACRFCLFNKGYYLSWYIVQVSAASFFSYIK